MTFEQLFQELLYFIETDDIVVSFIETDDPQCGADAKACCEERSIIIYFYEDFDIRNLFCLMHEYGHILAYSENGHRHSEQDAWDCALLGMPDEYHNLPGYNEFVEESLATYDNDSKVDEYGIPIFSIFASGWFK
jgi:hypothetical protein